MPATAMGAAHRLLQTIEPEAAAAATTFGFASTWLGLWLTGERAIDPTQASYTGLMASTDGSCRWLDDVLHRLGIPPQQLPPVRPSLSVLGALQRRPPTRSACRTGIPVLVGSADTPAASYALGTKPGGRPLLIMGTTHVVSNALDAPDHRASALQRVDVRAGRWLINGVINGGDALAYGAQRLGYGHGDVAVEALVGMAFSAEPGQMAGAPVFIPHTRPERGPLWFAEPRTALLGAIPDTAAPSAARGVVEGVLFADRMIIESCIGEHHEPSMSVARSASNPRCRNCFPTYWSATSWSSTKATCPPSVPPPCAAKSSTGRPSRRRRPAVCSPAHSGATSLLSAGRSTARYGPASPTLLRRARSMKPPQCQPKPGPSRWRHRCRRPLPGVSVT